MTDSAIRWDYCGVCFRRTAIEEGEHVCNDCKSDRELAKAILEHIRAIREDR